MSHGNRYSDEEVRRWAELHVFRGLSVHQISEREDVAATWRTIYRRFGSPRGKELLGECRDALAGQYSTRLHLLAHHAIERLERIIESGERDADAIAAVKMMTEHVLPKDTAPAVQVTTSVRELSDEELRDRIEAAAAKAGVRVSDQGSGGKQS